MVMVEFLQESLDMMGLKRLQMIVSNLSTSSFMKNDNIIGVAERDKIKEVASLLMNNHSAYNKGATISRILSKVICCIGNTIIGYIRGT
jgi:hypothetical protein